MFCVATTSAHAATVFQENFDLGNRPRNANGALRQTDIGDTINAYWAAYPGVASVRWQTAASVADTGWSWGSQSNDPAEPALPGQPAKNPSNGIAVGSGISSATAPFTATAGTSYTLAAGVQPPVTYLGNPDPGADQLRIGFASSAAVGVGVDNLAGNGVAWIVRRNDGSIDLHTAAASTSTPIDPQAITPGGIEHLTLQYLAATSEVRAWSDRAPTAVLSLPLASFAPTFVGMDAHRDERRPARDGRLATGDERRARAGDAAGGRDARVAAASTPPCVNVAPPV